jgi:hypothetical protein
LSNYLKTKVAEGVNQHAKPVHDRLHMHHYFISF